MKKKLNYLFRYKETEIKHDNKTFIVQNKEFDNVDDAKKYVDNLNLSTQDNLKKENFEKEKWSFPTITILHVMIVIALIGIAAQMYFNYSS